MKSSVRTSAKGQRVTPKAIREKIKLTPEKSVIVDLRDDYVVVKPMPNLRKALGGSLKGKPPMSQAVLREHQTAVQQDEKPSIGCLPLLVGSRKSPDMAAGTWSKINTYFSLLPAPFPELRR